MTIKDRNLAVGTKLVARYHKQQHTCQIIAGEGDKLRYRLEDGREFKSPSGAGMAITGHACDGWAFWSVETATATPAQQIQQPEAQESSKDLATGFAELERQLENYGAPAAEQEDAVVTPAPTEEKEETPAITTTTAQTSPAKKRIFRLPNQKGVPEGQTRWYCHDCGQSFTVATGTTPESCPQGHRA